MARIVEGDAGKIICKEAVRLKPAAVVMGTRGRGLVQRFFVLFFCLPLTPTHLLYFCAHVYLFSAVFFRVVRVNIAFTTVK